MSTIPQRFWAKVDRRGDDECWPWTAAGVSKMTVSRIVTGQGWRHVTGDAVPPLMAAHILASVGAGELTEEAVA